MHYGGEWFGLTITGIQKFWNSWFNDPNSDWQTLCDCGYDYDYDFDQVEYNGWNPVYGQWATAEQFYSTGSSPYRLQVDRTFGTPFDGLQEVRVKVSWSSTGSPQCQLTVTHSGGEDVLSHSYVSSGWITFTLPDTRNGVSYIKFYTATAVGVSCSHDRFALAGIGDVKPPEPV